MCAVLAPAELGCCGQWQRAWGQSFLPITVCIVQDLVESVSVMNDHNNDWFLVAPDFTDYMRAQACPHPCSTALLF